MKARLQKLAEILERNAYAELVKDITPKKETNEPFSSYKDQLGFGKIKEFIHILHDILLLGSEWYYLWPWIPFSILNSMDILKRVSICSIDWSTDGNQFYVNAFEGDGGQTMNSLEARWLILVGLLEYDMI